ncbi:AEC family transporter [Saccharibacillus sp. CPCC 101409]|uniref:AEC family transporter n=1 Tax=Saccharibacillus sp. CPCC 101409 TaxID=3058041 RepID=UPI002671A6AF|nr:AEC family transporter [Saccharibacillus sp. CPCC 101409]MDO3408313.1 AEC family transporter [Saccharibacillus sp. CPCC 101409]
MIFQILLNVVLPVFILIVAGSAMQRLFRLDLYTLSKINFYYITPAVVFMSLYRSAISVELLGGVALFYGIYIGVLYALCFILTRSFKYTSGMKAAFTNSVLLDNSGNYGLPINQLVFAGSPLAASIQALLMAFQSLLTFTYGVISIQGARLSGNYRSVLIGFMKMPVPYALVLGFAFHAFAVPLPNFVTQPLGYVQNSMVAIALLTLGAQIVQYPLRLGRLEIYFSMILRLIIAPVIGYILILAFGMKGLPAQALLIASGMPTGVNSSILAEEYRNEPDFAAQTVLVSTLLNIVTVTILITVAKGL